MKNKFRCTLKELYSVCISGWNTCLTHIEVFSKFRLMYSKKYIEDSLAEVNRVKAMPANAQRKAVNQTRRAELLQEVKQCLRMWKKLKRYISLAYPEHLLKAKLTEAGIDQYEATTDYSWEACDGLMEAANNFVISEEANLLANDNMPVEFKEELKVVKGKFNGAYTAWMESGKVAIDKGSEKQKASMELYLKLMVMMLDGQTLFVDEPEIKRKFIFDYELLRISGTNGAGIKGKIKGDFPVSAISTLKLWLVEAPDDDPFIDDDGSYRFSQLAARNYTMHVEAEGYQSQDILVTVNTGAFTMRDIVMEKEERD